MPTDSKHPSRIECPRCGYDLRGVVSAWTDRCPIDGVCAECGLQFQWAELLSETIGGPGWCLEFARSRWDFLRRAVTTLAMSFRPWRFWQSLKMSHEVRWSRLIQYIAVIVIVFYVMFCLGQGALAFQQWYGSRNPTVPPFQPVHYSAYEIFHALLLPLSDRAPAPTGVPPTFFLSPRDLYDSYWGILPIALVPFLVLHALCAAGFVTLPVSRRIAKVRWSHVVRVAVYGLVLSVPAGVLAVAGVVLTGEAFSDPSSTSRFVFVLAGIAAIAVLPAEVVWWSLASGRYMKLRHPWGVGVAVVVMAVLAATALFVVLLLSFD